MPHYVLNRNYYHSSTMGHAIRFTKGEPVFVPSIIEKEVIALGAERVDGERTDPLEPEQVEAPVMGQDERETKIVDAMESIYAKNDSKDFTGQGVPSVKALERILGFDVDRAEVNGLWNAFKIAKAEAQ